MKLMLNMMKVMGLNSVVSIRSKAKGDKSSPETNTFRNIVCVNNSSISCETTET